MEFYQDTLDLFNLNSREPMNIKLLLEKGARSVRASDANVVRAKIWRGNLDSVDKLLNSTFHSYALDKQMPMRWLVDNESEAFFKQRDIEIEKGQGRVDRNHLYKEIAYKYLISK